MKRALHSLFFIVFSLAAAEGIAADRIEIVIDNSTDMRQALGSGPPRFVALREALLDFSAAWVFGPSDVETGLWSMGGGKFVSGLEGCGDGDLTLAAETHAPEVWRTALAGLQPGGPRSLAQSLVAIAAAATDNQGGRRRLVLVTAGTDQCHEDIALAISTLTRSQQPFELRIIGLGLDRETAEAANSFAPTQNVVDAAKLVAALNWATNFDGTTDPRAVDFTFDLGANGASIDGSDAVLINSATGEETSAAIKSGIIRTRLVPGRYRASIAVPDGRTIELAGLATTSSGSVVELTAAPPVTLEIVNDPMGEGEPIFVQFWGAPEGVNWVTVAPAESPLGHYLTRAEAPGEQAEIELDPPGSVPEMEVRFVHEPSPGISQLLGTIPVQQRRGRTRFDVPDAIPTNGEFELAWIAPNRPGDRIVLSLKNAPERDNAICIIAASGGPATLVSPPVPGNYSIRYLSASGATLESKTIEVFEVLSTLDAPEGARPGQEISIEWTGPDDPTDFLSIATTEASGNEYVEFSPTTNGSPLQLRAPPTAGSYEIRYVRGEDSEILAREILTVASVPVEIEVPEIVDAGTRFRVRLEGTPAAGDIVAIVDVGSDPYIRIDWTYAVTTVPLTLAAPFEPGEYEILYTAGKDSLIVRRIPIRVR